jgi:aryl-alcohol dehydrogenase-like predicted oxidoreductase
MTWGQQNTEVEGHAQMDYAFENGVNFFDTAEMYSIPARPETQGSTERIIGNWFRKTGNRDKIILASKVTGPSIAMRHISDRLGYSRERIQEAINLSLQRLQTDYIDLYQLHWPERKSNFFSTLGYRHDPNEQWIDNFNEVVSILDGLKKAGKIRHWGLSNETPWGIMRSIQASDHEKIDRPVSIQNPYNLLNRSYEVGMAEISIRENIGLLAYSPLGFGRLSGKFENGTDSPNDRINQFKNYVRYNKPHAIQATRLYMDIAKQAGLSPTQLALAFVNDQPFVVSNIIGATNMDQLKENISSIEVSLSKEVLLKIDEVHEVISNPSP